MTPEEITFFDNIAPRWDGMEVRSLPSRINYILDRMDIRAGMKVADLGTGTGVLLPYLSERVGESGQVVAVDGSSGMLDIARTKFSNLLNVSFLLSDFEEEIIAGRFDRILLYCVYPHLQRPMETLGKLITDHLKPGGRIYIAFPNDESFVNHIHGEKKSTADMLPSAPALALRLFDNGFRAKVVEYTPDSYLVSVSSD